MDTDVTSPAPATMTLSGYRDLDGRLRKVTAVAGTPRARALLADRSQHP